MEYDLEKRTGEFSIDLISLCKKIKISIINENIIKQVLRSGTSVGANYCEANGATSKADFKSKIHICKRESKETMYWLSLLKRISDESLSVNIDELWQESKELSLIFCRIALSSKN